MRNIIFIKAMMAVLTAIIVISMSKIVCEYGEVSVGAYTRKGKGIIK